MSTCYFLIAIFVLGAIINIALDMHHRKRMRPFYCTAVVLFSASSISIFALCGLNADDQQLGWAALAVAATGALLPLNDISEQLKGSMSIWGDRTFFLNRHNNIISNCMASLIFGFLACLVGSALINQDQATIASHCRILRKNIGGSETISGDLPNAGKPESNQAGNIKKPHRPAGQPKHAAHHR